MSALTGREAYRQELTRLAYDDDRIVCLEADLGGKDHPFQAAHPDRFFNLGIAEAAMIDLAGALAVAGLKPFVSTFAPFAAMRAAESLKLTLGYLGASVSVIAPYAGVSGAWFGTTHHCLEDLAVVRSIPGVVIAAPYGEAEMRRVIYAAVESGCPHYIRTGRNARYTSLAEPLPGEVVSWVAADGSDRPGGHPGTPCLVSVGEEATRLCLEATAVRPDLAHAHLCRVDHGHLTLAAAELRSRYARFIVVEEHRTQGGVAEGLALLMPACHVRSVAAGVEWPTEGGDHQEVMAHLGLDLNAVLHAAELTTTP